MVRKIQRRSVLNIILENLLHLAHNRIEIIFAFFANFEKKLYLCGLKSYQGMEVKFEKEYLREPFYYGETKDKQHRYQPHIVRRYVRVVNILDSVEKVIDLYRYRALHYEKLVGDKAGLESVRVNDQYRIEFKASANDGITICNIIELSNHYK